MLNLSCLWLLIGLVPGCLAYIARFRIYPAHRWSLLYTVGLCALLMVGYGWLNTWLFGRYFATSGALWMSIMTFLLLCSWRQLSGRLFSWLHF